MANLESSGDYLMCEKKKDSHLFLIMLKTNKQLCVVFLLYLLSYSFPDKGNNLFLSWLRISLFALSGLIYTGYLRCVVIRDCSISGLFKNGRIFFTRALGIGLIFFISYIFILLIVSYMGKYTVKYSPNFNFGKGRLSLFLTAIATAKLFLIIFPLSLFYDKKLMDARKESRNLSKTFILKLYIFYAILMAIVCFGGILHYANELDIGIISLVVRLVIYTAVFSAWVYFPLVIFCELKKSITQVKNQTSKNPF